MAFNPVRSHQIHDTLKRLLELQQSAILSGPDGAIDEQRRWYLNKIFYLAETANKLVRRRLSYSLSLNALNNLNNSAETIVNELNSFISNRNIAHIDNAFNQAEQGFQIYMNQSIPHGNGSEAKDAEILIESLHKSFEAAISALKSERDALSEQLAGLTASVAASAESVATLEAAIVRQKGESEIALSKIAESYESLEGDLQAKFEEDLNRWSGENAAALKKVDEETSDLVSLIARKEEEARALIQSVGDILITGTYNKRAKDEYRLSNLFR